MRNITVTVNDEVYTRARVWAAEHNTSVSAVVQYMLSTLRTDWRAKAFVAALERNPENPRPIAPPRPAVRPSASAPAAPTDPPSHADSTTPSIPEEPQKAAQGIAQ